MARAKRISFKGTVERHAEALELITAPADIALVERGVPRSLAINCPDGCGETISVNLDQRSGPAWRLYKTGDKITLYPSVDRPTGCKAHFIIWRNQIIWCGVAEEDSYWSAESDREFQEHVLAALPSGDQAQAHYEEIAAKIDASPWEVLWTCRALEREGLAISSGHRTHFGRLPVKRHWWQFWKWSSHE